MKPRTLLTTASLLTILLMTLHLTSDAVRAKAGNPEGGGSTLVAVPVLFVWLYGTLMLGDRRSGRIIMLVGSIIGLGMPVVHSIGPTGLFTGQMNREPGPFLFIWTLHLLGVISMFSLVLAARLLWRPPAD